jgi:hypothetical protein
VKVELSEEADEQVREIDARWREHRRAAPDLFANLPTSSIARCSTSATCRRSA